MSSFQNQMQTGLKIRLGQYYICLFNHGLSVLGPCSSSAQKAEDLLIELLNTNEGCKLLGATRKANGHPARESAKSKLAIKLKLPQVDDDNHFDPLPELDYDDDNKKIRTFQLPAIYDRTITELHGMCTSIVYDGKVDDNEIRQIRDWLNAKQEFADAWPISDLHDLMKRILADQVVSDTERDELRQFLESLSADPDKCGEAADNIFDQNPKVEFTGKVFLITGALKLCKRKEAWEKIKDKGGKAVNSPSKKVDFLVVGDLGTDMWKFSRYGRKIEVIIENKRDGASTMIIREQDFVKALEIV